MCMFNDEHAYSVVTCTWESFIEYENVFVRNRLGLYTTLTSGANNSKNRHTNGICKNKPIDDYYGNTMKRTQHMYGPMNVLNISSAQFNSINVELNFR